jgi:competence protein ComEC
MFNKWLKLNKNKRRILLSIIFCVVSWSVIFYLVNQRPRRLEVDFLDVGQGDATLIKIPDGPTILIDGGPDNKVLRRLGENLPFYSRQIDFIILSHYHDDHAAGLVEVLKRYKIHNLIYAAAVPPSSILAEMGVAMQEQKITPLALDSQARISWGANCFLDLLNPVILGIKDDPNNSLVVKLDCEAQKFLFTGDDSAVVEKALLASGRDWRADIFKAAHHGSNSANSELFLNAVSPQLLVISVGADNRFGHPSPKILERAVDLGIKIKRTDREGDIRIFSP